ncbi:MAG: hypothetical protein QOI65_1891 [Thermoleophilaceae bacterium]|nr:hypothetical protein [Thermoleophilaceae bacterium]
MRPRALVIALLVLAAGAVLPQTASAGCDKNPIPYVVQTTADEVDGTSGDPAGPDGNLSLREAVNAANSEPDEDEIDVPAGTYNLPLGTLSVDASCFGTIKGAGARQTIIDGGDQSRVLTTSVATSISGVTISHGRDTSGGGILSSFQLTLDKVTIRDNVAQDTGGGIESSGILTVLDSTISGNGASPVGFQSSYRGQGGGIHTTGGPATLSNVTLSSNHAGTGSALDGIGGGLMNGGVLDIVSSTLASNSASGAGGNVYNAGGNVHTLNSLYVAGVPANCAGTLPFGTNSSGDHSMSSDSTCLGGATANLTLGPLLDNGGATDTRAPLPGSPAIDGGESLCPNDPQFPKSDQRGIPRPPGHCDVGALEVVKTGNLKVAMTDLPDPFSKGAAPGITYLIKVTSTGPALDATQPILRDVLPAGWRAIAKTSSQGTCSGVTTVTCALGTLPNGAAATIAITIVGSSTSSTVGNTVTVSSPRPDAALADDSATVQTTVATKLDDVLTGGPGHQIICGLAGDDTIKGLAGDDELFGDACGKKRGKGGNDKLVGGPGGDTLVGGGGKNSYRGGPGNDSILAVNGKADKIDCGAGAHDFAKVDPSDSVKGCEAVKHVK